MLRFVALLMCLIGTGPIAAEPRHVTGEEDGVSFDYTAAVQMDGTMVLRGTYLNTDDKFLLVVSRRGHVEGAIGGNPVSFDVPQKIRDQAVADTRMLSDKVLAQRTTLR